MTKTAQFERAWQSAIRVEEAHDKWEQFETFRDSVEGKVFKARVCWFRSDGTGWVELEDGSRYPIFACNIEGKKTWYPETACVYYEKDQVIDVTLSVYTDRVFVIGVTPGTFDQEKWNSLDQDRLAFKCNEEGRAITGLFAAAK